MNVKKNILIVIPARGGSKGIPRKNLRLLSGKPLIYYIVKTAKESKYKPSIYVSSDDDEILNTAVKFKVNTHKRDLKISDDKTTLDPVIYDCYLHAKSVECKEYDIIITLQPTSPLLSTKSLDLAIDKMIKENNIDTLISARDNTHLSWKKINNKFKPDYKRRLNRQYLTPQFTETGGFLITRSSIISEENRIGKNVELIILDNNEAIDIDSYEDWNLCDYYLNRKKILFVVTGNSTVGLGHVYNTLLIANDILNHEVLFLVDKESKMAHDVIQSKNYPVKIQKASNIINDIKTINPDIIINDILDTKQDYIKSLKENNYKIINFEDLGRGSKYADLVINAIYPKLDEIKNHHYGEEFFILRDEFMLSNSKIINRKIKNILITFGGVDPSNYTKRVVDIINEYCQENKITINVVAGFGYNKYDSLKQYTNINIHKDIKNISDFMLLSDIIFTSAGRTVYEIASIGTPAIIIAQNKRELTHFFASAENGFINMGLGKNITDIEIRNTFLELLNSYEKRKKMNSLMMKKDLKLGRKKVNKLIQNLINN